jgi:O-antigen/teichoic acid export membrane protein
MISLNKGNTKKSIALNAFNRIIMYILNLLVPVVVGPYLARVLDVGLYAQYNAALSIVQWFLPIAVFGIYTYGMRQASREREDEYETRKVFTKLFLFGVISTSTALLIYFLFALTFKKNEIWLYSLLSINIVANYFAIEWLNEAFENYKFILYKTMLVRIAYVISIFIFVRKADDVLPYTAIASGVIFFNNFFGYLYIRRKVKFTKVSFGEILSLARPLLVVMLLTNTNMLFLMLDRLFLSVFAKEKIFVTFYTMAMLITMSVMNVVNSIFFVAVPRLSNLFAGGNREEYKELLASNSHAFFLVAMPIFAGIACLGNEIMYIYGGGNYLGAGTTLAVFGLMFLVYAIDLSLANQVLFVSGMERILLVIYLIGGGANLLFDLALLMVGRLTPTLLISTTLIADIFVVIMQQHIIRREFGRKFSPLDFSTLKYLLLSLSFLPIAQLIRRAYKVEMEVSVKFALYVITVILTCSIFYFAVLLISKDRYLTPYVKSVFSRIGKVLRRH